MEQLIKVRTNEKGLKVVSARELFDFLEVKERFSKFMKRNLEYGFQENVDYTLYTEVHPQNKQDFVDFELTLDTAKEICYKNKRNKKAGIALKCMGFELKHIHTSSRFEESFKTSIFESMKELSLKIIPQFRCENYYIDFYIPSLNIAVEYDEKHHKYRKKQDLERQKYIENKIKCKFIRCNYKDSDLINIIKILKFADIVRITA